MSTELDSVVDLAHFDKWQPSLIHMPKRFSDKKEASNDKENVTHRQERFLEALSQRPGEVMSYLLSELQADESSARDIIPLLPEIPEEFTQDEFKRLPIGLELEILGTFEHSGIPVAYAAEPRFWSLSHAIWIGDGRFGDDVFSMFCTGKDTEAQTRSFLRKTGGLPVVRGNTSVLDDCPVAKAYWRCRLAKEIAETVRIASQEPLVARDDSWLTREKAHEVLHHPHVWTRLVGTSLRRITALNAPRARAAFVVAFADEASGMDSLNTTQQKRAVFESLLALGRKSYDYSLWHVHWDVLVEIATEGLKKGATFTESDDDDDSDTGEGD